MRKLVILIIISIGWKIAKGQKNDSLRFESYFQKAEQLKGKAETFDSALYWSDRMLKEAHTLYQKGVANFVRGNVISSNDWGYNRGEFALPYLEKAVNYFAQIKNREKLHHALNVLALCYDRNYNPNNRKSSAKSLLYMAMAFKVQHDSTYEVKTPFKATFDDKPATKKEFLEAISITKANLAFWESKGEVAIHYQMWRNQYLGMLYWYLTGNLAQTSPYFIKAAAIAQKVNDQMFYSFCLGPLVVYCNQSKEYQKAILFGEQGLVHALDTLKSDFRESIFRDQLYIAYKEMGQMDKAIMHKERALQIAEKIYREAESKRIIFMRERNNELQKRVELEQLLNNQQKHQQWYTISVLFLLALVGYIFYSNYQLRQKNREISAASLQGQTTERKRIAADLHDNLGSTMSALRWSLEAINPKQLGKKEQEVYQQLQYAIAQAYDQVRLLSHNFLPEELEKQGLWVALGQLIRKLNKNTPVKFSLQLPENQVRLNEKTEFELYSICLELINNILKHAKATEASIECRIQSGEYRMVISDNGKGISENNSSGKGLRNIAERVRSLGGTWQVTSEEGNGVVNEINVPL